MGYKESLRAPADRPSAEGIAASLFICEGTVRNVIKLVYKKTNVRGKGPFISKFSL